LKGAFASRNLKQKLHK